MVSQSDGCIAVLEIFNRLVEPLREDGDQGADEQGDAENGEKGRDCAYQGTLVVSDSVCGGDDALRAGGGIETSAGSVTLWTLPTETGAWKFVVNKETGQWGTAYKAENDLGRVDMKTEALETAVEQFTIAIEAVGNGGQIVMMWDKTKMIVPFSAM